MDKITITIATPASAATTVAHWFDWIPEMDLDTMSALATSLLPLFLLIWWAINIVSKIYSWFKPEKP